MPLNCSTALKNFERFVSSGAGVFHRVIARLTGAASLPHNFSASLNSHQNFAEHWRHGQVSQCQCCGGPPGHHPHAAAQVSIRSCVMQMRADYTCMCCTTRSMCHISILPHVNTLCTEQASETALCSVHSADLREHVHFERTFCLSCSMNGLDLRMPTAFTTTLHGAPVCNEHSVGQVSSRPGHDDRTKHSAVDELTKYRLSACSWGAPHEHSKPYTSPPLHFPMVQQAASMHLDSVFCPCRTSCATWMRSCVQRSAPSCAPWSSRGRCWPRSRAPHSASQARCAFRSAAVLQDL